MSASATSSSSSVAVQVVLDLLAQARYAQAIAALRTAVQQDRRVLADPAIKPWLGRRWRNLFLQAATADRRAVRVAHGLRGLVGKRRPVMQQLGERFLLQATAADWDSHLPPAQLPAGPRPTLVFCPGFLNGLLPVHAFEPELRDLQDAGWPVLCADAHPVRGCEANVSDLLAAVREGRGFLPVPGQGADVELVSGPPPGDMVLMGYSKGSPDILCLLAAHPELRSQVKAVFTWAGAIGGSFTANKIHELIRGLPLDAVTQHLHDFLSLLLPGITRKGTLRRLDEYAISEAVASLTTHEREAFLQRHGAALDALAIPFFNVTGATSLFEVPTFQMADYLALAKVDPDNDMQVTQQQSRLDLPMASHLATLHGHHWDIAYPPFPRKLRLTTPNLDHPFPRHAGLLANLQLTVELGLAG